jgi:hypothetical protein
MATLLVTATDEILGMHRCREGRGAGRRDQGGSPAWNPTLLEITVAGCAAGDRPVDWAMWVQQQRFPDHYRDEGLKLPLLLHLAAKATEYTPAGIRGGQAPGGCLRGRHRHLR